MKFPPLVQAKLDEALVKLKEGDDNCAGKLAGEAVEIAQANGHADLAPAIWKVISDNAKMHSVPAAEGDKVDQPARGGGGKFGGTSRPVESGGGKFGGASRPVESGGGKFGNASRPVESGGGKFGSTSNDSRPARGGGGKYGSRSEAADSGEKQSFWSWRFGGGRRTSSGGSGKSGGGGGGKY